MSQPLTLRTETGDEDLDLDEFEVRVRRGEVSPQCLVRFPALTGDAFVPACELEVWKSLHAPRRAHFARAFSLLRFPWLTCALVAVNIGAYVWSTRSGPLDMDAMVTFGGKAPALITDLGQFWRLLTANFLHWTIPHLLVNLFVLFNVGAALENAYRRLDYLFLLVVSGICTMVASLIWEGEVITVGASGMVYGCLGGIVVFGLKYRSILPSRYRRILGEAAIPIVLLLFLMGFVSPGTDNAAHLGGLLAGVGVALFLRPRLLAELPRTRWAPALRALPSALLLFLVFCGQAILGDVLPPLRLERDDGFGISIQVPATWQPGANRFGQLAFFNGLPGVGRATFAAQAAVQDDPPDVTASVQRFIDDQLTPAALGPDVLKVIPHPPEPARIGDRDALLVRAEVDEPFGRTRLLAYFVPRGNVLYQLVWTYPTEYPRYQQLVEEMAANVRFDEPRAERKARAKALLFPNAPWALAEVGTVLYRLGEWHPAAEALTVAVRAQPSSLPWRSALALAQLADGMVEEGCRSAEQAVLYGPDDPQVLEVAARCELARGNPARALERIRQARHASPSDARLARAEKALAEAVGDASAEAGAGR
ncbi:MAG: rhomboid family intramembrane serine protease [Myxococcaceae bacterium]|nr:rhomboid family intramembrane serine protease [Myxococcaceae bacterium]